MKKIITFLICLPLLINAQSGISIDTLYSGTTTDVLIYNHTIDFNLSGGFNYPYGGVWGAPSNIDNGANYKVRNVNIINADTAVLTIFCHSLSITNNNIANPFIYKFDYANDIYDPVTQFYIIDTLSHNFEIKPNFTSLEDTITIEARTTGSFFDSLSSWSSGLGPVFISEMFKPKNFYGSLNVNATLIETYSVDSVYKGNIDLNTSAQTGFQTFYLCYLYATGGATIYHDTISKIDSAIFINSPLTGNSTISGTITAGSGKIQGELLESLLVYLIDENNNYAYATQTNSNGYFVFENTEIGNYKIVAGDKYNEQFSVTGGDNLSLSFKDGKLETVINSINTIQKEDISIFPNPTSKYITIKQLDNKMVKSVKIVNLQGQEVMFINEPKTKIDVSDLENGIYIVRLSYNGKYTNYKLMKN